MKPIYLFDFDGTLVDSMPLFSSSLLRILYENNIPHDPDVIATVVPLGYRGAADHFKSLGIDLPIDAIVARMQTLMLEAYATSVPLKEKVGEALLALHAAGADLNILTASPHAALDAALSRLGIFDLFTNVWSCEDFGTTKSDPAIYVSAAERLGAAPSDVIFVDDNLTAIETAKRAGMQTVGVYDEAAADKAEALAATADRYIRDFGEL